MLVCHCLRVNDQKVRQCIREGACSAEQVAEGCHAGTACGGCKPLIEALIQLESRREGHERAARPAVEPQLDAAGA